MKFSAIIYTILLATISLEAQTINWDTPIDVSTEEFGNKANRLALNSSGEPMILHGASGSNAGLYLSVMENGEFNDPIQVTPDTNIFLSETEGPTMDVSGSKIVVGYQIAGEWATGARIVMSNDDGLTWSDPISINDDPTVDFFMPCVAFDPEDNPFIGFKWGENPTLEGIMTYNAFFNGFNDPVDGSAGIIGDAVCECCPSAPFSHNGAYYNLVRNNNNNIRDMQLAVSYDGVTWDSSLDVDPTDWLTNTCPATGASHTVSSASVLTTTYMSAPNGSRIYYTSVALETMEVISHGMIDPTANDTENNPVVSSSGSFVVTAWERNSSGYDIMATIAMGDLSNSTGAVNITEDLDISGHKRNPSVTISGSDVHLTFKSVTEGVVKYMKGTVSGMSIDPISSDINPLKLSSTENNWVVSSNTDQHNYNVFDTSGRLQQSGFFNSQLILEKQPGLQILNVDGETFKLLD